jgi:eukaryotic-like serine/threonine-protein kinase
VAIRCPYCDFSIAIKNAKPGRFIPKCPKCAQSFTLTVPADPDAEWVVKTNAPPKEKSDATEATGGFVSSTPALVQKKAVVKSDATEATGGFEPSQTPERKGPKKASTGDVDRTEVRRSAGPSLLAPNERTAASPFPSIVEQTADHASNTDGTPNKKAKSEGDLPDKLGGYEVVKELGRGGMGAVYLARQVSLDRPVALKVMNEHWADDPVFLARFTREAYAAAQLVHHNVVQIYDFGEDKGVNFFSMEFVEGKSLGDLIKKNGKICAEEAIGYTLQAARGLKFAHDRGMIHRDIKPDNLMLNNQGIVKVADLGLVKTPAMSKEEDALPAEQGAGQGARLTKTKAGLASLPEGMTHAHSAMGSPAYMSPEQCRDAASVDQRADVYSLGCSLYVLLTGQTPFRGTTVFEVMTKHASEAPPPPHKIANSVPEEVSAIALKMLEKEPERRYQDMNELIRDLERWLGVKGMGFRPTEENLKTLETSAEQFNLCSLAKVRSYLIQGFVAACLVGAFVSLFISTTVAVGLIGLLLQGSLAYFIISGMSGKTYLFRKTREFVFGFRISDWLTLVFGVALFAGLLYLTGMLWAWLGFGGIGLILALAVHFVIDPQVSSQRGESVNECESMFKRMRLQGCEEEALRRFVVQYSGRNWEELYEALFGLEAKLTARAFLGEDAANRARHGAWREPILKWIDRAQAARKEVRERKLLQRLEAKKLQAEGMDRKAAEVQAEAAAAQFVEQAAEIKAAEQNRTRGATSDETAPRTPINIKRMLQAAEKPPKKREKPPAQPVKYVFTMIFGWKLRFVVGALLIAGAVLWVRQNLRENPVRDLSEVGNVRDVQHAKQEALKLYDLAKTIASSEEYSWKPLNVQVVGSLFDHINPLVAGLILIVSVFYGSIFATVLFMTATLVALSAYKFNVIPEVGPLKPYHLSMIAGAIIAIVAILFGRRRG